MHVTAKKKTEYKLRVENKRACLPKRILNSADVGQSLVQIFFLTTYFPFNFQCLSVPLNCKVFSCLMLYCAVIYFKNMYLPNDFLLEYFKS